MRITKRNARITSAESLNYYADDLADWLSDKLWEESYDYLMDDGYSAREIDKNISIDITLDRNGNMFVKVKTSSFDLPIDNLCNYLEDSVLSELDSRIQFGSISYGTMECVVTKRAIQNLYDEHLKSTWDY